MFSSDHHSLVKLSSTPGIYANFEKKIIMKFVFCIVLFNWTNQIVSNTPQKIIGLPAAADNGTNNWHLIALRLMWDILSWINSISSLYLTTWLPAQPTPSELMMFVESLAKCWLVLCPRVLSMFQSDFYNSFFYFSFQLNHVRKMS